MDPVRKKLGEILLEMGAVDELQLQAAVRFQQQWGIRVGRSLVDSRFCSAADVTRGLSIQSGYPVIDLDGFPLDPELAKELPAKHAEQLRVVPLRVEGQRREVLVIAAEGPAGFQTVDAVRNVSGKRRIVVHLANDEAIEQAIGFMYHARPRTGPKAVATGLGTHVGIQNDVVFELESEPLAAMVNAGPPRATPASVAQSVVDLDSLFALAPAPVRPVLLFGWHDASGRALGAMLKQGGVEWTVIDDLEALQPDDLVLATTLGLQADLPFGAKIQALLVVAGMPGDVDAADAEAMGASVYLRPPFTLERVCGAVRRCREKGRKA